VPSAPINREVKKPRTLQHTFPCFAMGAANFYILAGYRITLYIDLTSDYFNENGLYNAFLSTSLVTF
jgi:hypothetical protein